MDQMLASAAARSLRFLGLCAVGVLICGQTFADVNPVGHWKLDEGSGTTPQDSSGNGNHCTMSPVPAWTAGRINGALQYDGADGTTACGTGASLATLPQMTVAAWVNLATAGEGGFGRLVQKGDGGNPTAGWRLVSQTSNRLEFSVDLATDDVGRTTVTGALPWNTWAHIAATWAGSASQADVKIYVNGVETAYSAGGDGAEAHSSDAAAVLRIGSRDGANGTINGKIDDVRVYNRVLMPSEIVALADATSPGATSGLGATPVSASQINLSWTAATDNVAVTEYRIERCAGSGCTTFAQIGTAAGTTFNNTGLTASTLYRYQVRASDANTNLGAYSSIAQATTAASGDSQAPSAPGTLSGTANSSVLQIDLSWGAATDNVGVTGYSVERCLNASCTYAVIRELNATAYSDLTVVGSTAYRFRIRARDAAGNFGPYSNAVTVTSAALTEAESLAYGYDQAGRLRTVDYAGGTNTEYTLDAAGNRKQVATGLGAGTLQISQSTLSTGESGTFAVPVYRTGANAGAISVHYATANGSPNGATAGSDYTSTSGNLNWVDGDSIPKSINVPILTDPTLEGNEIFTVTLSSPTGGAELGTPKQTTVTILDDDGVAFSIGNVSVNESAANVTLTVTKSGGTSLTHAVNFATANGTATGGADYTAQTGTLSFAPAETAKTIVVSLLGDATYEGNQTFTVGLSGPTNGATVLTPSGTVTIIENDVQPSFAINNKSAGEGTGLVFTVTRSGSTAATNNVNYALTNGTAIAGTHYTTTSGTLAFAAGQVTKTFTVTTLSDNKFNNNLTFTATLSAPTNLAVIGDGSGTGTIVNVDPAPEFRVFGSGALEGASITFGVNKSGATALTHTVQYATSNATAAAPGDYASASGTLSFLPADTTKNVNVATVNDTAVENTETFNFALSAPGNGAVIEIGTAAGVIGDGDSPPPAPTISKSPSGIVIGERQFLHPVDGDAGRDRLYLDSAKGFRDAN